MQTACGWAASDFEPLAPGGEVATSEIRLGGVVDHDGEVGMAVKHAQHRRDMTRPQQRVEDEIMGGHCRKSRGEFGSREPICIGDVVDHGPQADEQGIAAEAGDARARVTASK